MADLQERPVITDAELVPGLEFPSVDHVLSREDIERYVRLFEDAAPAAGDRSLGPAARAEDLVAPPTIVATFTWPSRLMTTHRLPPGSVHASLDYELLEPIVAGSYVSRMRVASREERKGRTWLTLEVETTNTAGRPVFRGTNTIALAVQG
ncbi:MAG: FAS1-like dehydratase domain-containing protein [Candidatus Limnocylindrales bacterium]